MMQDGRLCLCRTTLCQSDTENSSSAALLYGRPRLPQWGGGEGLVRLVSRARLGWCARRI